MLVVGYARGNPYKLLYPTDSSGNICGYDTAYTWVYQLISRYVIMSDIIFKKVTFLLDVNQLLKLRGLTMISVFAQNNFTILRIFKDFSYIYMKSTGHIRISGI